MAIRNLLRDNIGIHSRRLISELQQNGVKCISKLQSRCVNMTFADKSRYDRIFQKVTHSGVYSIINCIKIFQNIQDLSDSVGNNYSEYQLMHILLDNFH